MPPVSLAPLRQSPRRRHNRPASRTCPDRLEHSGRSSGSGSRPILRSRSSRHRRCIRNRLLYKAPRRSGRPIHSSRSSSHGRTHPPRSCSGKDWSSPGIGAPGRYPPPRSVRVHQGSRHRRRSRSGHHHRRLPSRCRRSTLAGASREVALVRPHAVTRSTGETGVVGAARQPVIAVALHAAVAAAATARARGRRRTQRIAADRGRRAGSWSPRRTVRIVRAAEERRITTGVLRPGGAIAANARSRGIGADLLWSGRGASHLQP